MISHIRVPLLCKGRDGGAIALTRLVKTLLFELPPTDVATFAGVGALLLAAATAACYLPARRAAGVDPNVALRAE